MKDLLNLLEVSSENLPEIYLDMDGVIANFKKAADEINSLNAEYEKIFEKLT